MRKIGRVIIISLFLSLAFFWAAKTFGVTKGEESANKGIFVLALGNHFFKKNNNQCNQWRGDEVNQPLLEVLERPYVSGFTYWVHWRDVEPQEGDYCWELIDRVVSEVASRGKKINLGVMPGVTPGWVRSQVELFSYTKAVSQGGDPDEARTVTRPFPVDQTYLEKYYNFISALANHIPQGKNYPFRDEPALHYVAIGGPGNECGFNTVILADNEDSDNIKGAEYVIKRVKEIMKTDTFEEGYAQAWKETIRRFATSFPNKHLAIALSSGIRSLKPRDQPFKYSTLEPARLIRGYLKSAEYKNNYGVPVHLMTLNLSGNEHWRPDKNGDIPQQKIYLVTEGINFGFTIGFQMVGIVWGSATKQEGARPFDRALKKGVDIGSSWLEVWIADLLKNRYHINDEWYEWVAEIHPCMQSLCPGTFEQVIENPAIRAAQAMRPSFSLSSGWNQITWPNIPNYTARIALEDIDNDCGAGTAVALAKKEKDWWEDYVKNYGGKNFALNAGKSYHINVTKNCLWNP